MSERGFLGQYWKALLLIMVGLFLVVYSPVIPFHLYLPAWSHLDDTYVISPNGLTSLRIDQNFGGLTRLMLVAGNESLNFTIEQGEQVIVNERLSAGRYFFELQPGGNTFFLSFRNSGSSALSVYWIVWIYYYGITLQLLGLIPSSLGIIFAASTYRWNRKIAEYQKLAGKYFQRATSIREPSKKSSVPNVDSSTFDLAEKDNDSQVEFLLRRATQLTYEE